MILRTIVKRTIPMPRAIATTNTVFKFPINGSCIIASFGLSQSGSMMSSNPKMLPNRKPKIVEQKPQQEMMAARLIFFAR